MSSTLPCTDTAIEHLSGAIAMSSGSIGAYFVFANHTWFTADGSVSGYKKDLFDMAVGKSNIPWYLKSDSNKSRHTFLLSWLLAGSKTARHF